MLSQTELAERLRAVRLLCLDVDGVLTDGHLYWSDGGGWSQRFCVQDGFGIKLLQELGIEVAILSGGDIRSARARAESLRIRHAYFGLVDKVAAYEALAEKLGVAPAETAYVGDELVDVPLLCHVGFGATVPDAVDEVRDVAHYITRRPGGNGAVREVCDLIRRHSVAARGRTPGPLPAVSAGPSARGSDSP
ncbi:MAG TPA: HAD family hydrolase [Polyangia bacterium]|jgi:3-deoxy-D-manno-octulosonate 8-phosphate phosphatase (KDO 8-P phosphatase)|nr:HAD family hydrolase [Polyangia bacterium]